MTEQQYHDAIDRLFLIETEIKNRQDELQSLRADLSAIESNKKLYLVSNLFLDELENRIGEISNHGATESLSKEIKESKRKCYDAIKYARTHCEFRERDE